MTSKKILIIDDEVDISNIVEYSLQIEKDWEVSKANSVDEGIKKAESYKPDAILLDIVMSGDGIEIIKKLERYKVEKNIPIIVFTAKNITEVDRRKYESLKVSGIINKPFDPITLGEEIEKILN